MFPQHPIPLSFLHKASRIICCDGATEALLNYGLEPNHIVGDIDSLSYDLQQRYKHCLHYDSDQNTNDLTKSVNFCMERFWDEITIIGATGKREDHSIGNISLLADYAEKTKVQMITDHGVFIPMLKSERFESFAGQRVSIFSLTQDAIFTFHGLKYPITAEKIPQLWKGTLNEALGSEFSIDIDCGKVLVFREHNIP